MSEPLFQDFGPYRNALAVAAPVDVPPNFTVETAPRGAWPTLFGSPGKTSRSLEPLVSDQYRVVWQAPLGEAARPQSLLVGGGFLVVNGEKARGVFGLDGQVGGWMKRGGGAGFLDGDRRTLLAEADEGGLCTFTLPDGTRDAFVMLGRPDLTFSREAIQGPAVIAMLSVKRSHLGEPPSAMVETFRVNDWRAKSDLEIFEGFTPLSGIVRVKDGSAIFAAAPTGPVLATSDGIRWCDWLLRPLAERAWETQAQAISVSDDGCARVTCTDGFTCQLRVLPPDEMPIRAIDLPWQGDANWTPPLVRPDGGTILTPRGHAWSLDPDLQLRWSARRDEDEPMGTLSSNGILLLSGAELYAFTADGKRHVLWLPPARLMTPPILASGRIYVASADSLFALEPA